MSAHECSEDWFGNCYECGRNMNSHKQAEQAAHYEATAATMSPEQVRATMVRVEARREALTSEVL